MNAHQLAAYLIEADEVDPTLKTFLDRLLLRIFDTPSLMASLLDVQIISQDGDFLIQLDFKKLPDEVTPQVKRIIGHPNARAVEFDKEGTPHTGLEVKITGQELEQAKEVSKKRVPVA